MRKLFEKIIKKMPTFSCYFSFCSVKCYKYNILKKLAQNILDVRNEYFDMTLAEQYNPDTMPEDLKEAHHSLDLEVERCYRSEPFNSDEERLECLFNLYSKMVGK